MIKNITAVAIAAALSATLGACSSGSDTPSTTDNSNMPVDPNNGNNTGNTGNTGNTANPANPDGLPPGTIVDTNTPTGGGSGPTADTKAGAYIGNFGGADGVFVIDNDNQLAGLAIDTTTGAAQSLFGSLGAADTFTGDLRQYQHQESRPDGAGGSFGAVATLANPLSIDVTIVNGQTVESTAASPTAVALRGATGTLAVANAASLAGSWSGVHSFCGDAADGTLVDCQTLTTSLTFNGTEVTGSTVFTNTADETFNTLIGGGITEFGEASIIEFTWGDASGYRGVVFFNPTGDGRVVFVGERAGFDNPTISAVMTRN